MCAKRLNPLPDLEFRTRPNNGATSSGHIKSLKGKPIGDKETPKPFRDAGLHVQGKSGCTDELFEAMGNSITQENWIEFDTLAFEIERLGCPLKRLNEFATQQIADAMARGATVGDIETLRRKLTNLGASETALDRGTDAGWEAVNRLRAKGKKSKP